MSQRRSNRPAGAAWPSPPPRDNRDDHQSRHRDRRERRQGRLDRQRNRQVIAPAVEPVLAEQKCVVAR